jgi:hypothetical protein
VDGVPRGQSCFCPWRHAPMCMVHPMVHARGSICP